jgi:serine protease
MAPNNGLTERTMRDNRRVERKLPAGYIPRIVVKFHDYLPLPYQDAVERYFDDILDPRDFNHWKDLIQRFPGITFRRLITSAGLAQIKKSSPEAGARRDHDFFVLDSPRQDPEGLVEALNAWRSVVHVAYVKSPLGPPPGVRPSPSEVGTQPHHGSAGINAEYAWGITGGDGAAIQFADIEQGWVLNHEDLPSGIIELSSAKPYDYDYVGHGTAVLGIALAVPGNADPVSPPHGPPYCNCVGISPNVGGAYVVCEIDPAYPGNNQRENAIYDAIAQLNKGDVLLLESHIPLMNGSGYLPVEFEYAVYTAIKAATDKGIVVVEPAGNGGANGDGNLDNLVLWGDSGAIMVASAYASAAPSGSTRCPYRYCRPPDTNYGKRINCFAWADQVYTTGEGWQGGSPIEYTQFNGTSAASAMVAGTVLALQGIAQANKAGDPDPSWNYRFHPDRVRQLLSDCRRIDNTKPETGNTLSGVSNTLVFDPTDPTHWNAENIGVMPNLKAIIEQLGLAVDIYIRDFVGDTGNPHAGMISASPDIILSPFQVVDPQTAFGEGSGTENSDTLGAEAESGQDNYIYVRVRNRGGAGAENVTATVFWSEPATLLTPNLWKPNNGLQVTIPHVPAGDVLTVSDAIVWSRTDIPATGHYCFVGLVGNSADPRPSPTDFMTWDNFERFIRENNNVTWRNFNIVNNVPDTVLNLRSLVKEVVRLPFMITGPHDEARNMQLELVARLPAESLLMLEVPINERRFIEELGEAVVDNERKVVLVSSKLDGSSKTSEIPFRHNLKVNAHLLIHVPEEFRRHTYDVYLRQLYKEREVGRITWRLAPKQQNG